MLITRLWYLSIHEVCLGTIPAVFYPSTHCVDFHNPLVDRCLILPGSFNPPHHGHLRIAQTAYEFVKQRNLQMKSYADSPIVCELCVNNCDKPSIDTREAVRRVELIQEVFGDYIHFAGTLITSKPLFCDKVEFCNAQFFVVGQDTVNRIFNDKYYFNPAASYAKLDNTQFLVMDRSGSVNGVATEHLGRCIFVPKSIYEDDGISSTLLRKRSESCQ